ncbi:TadE/TadG family type IV pilus assembly protein [Umezawaea sp. NPDC059074]|uniref:TadE/TadG family type IV pilus assembly protein n=1 Tax=Umezawaea sp. NPDC059074 TaxID=3346716 RepID=UPI003687A20A
MVRQRSTIRVRAALARVRRDQTGSGTVELVLATPLLLLLVLLIAQFALYLHAMHIAQSAASQALSATRVHGGSSSAGTAEGQRVLAMLGNGPLRDGSVSVRRGGDQASVTVGGTATNILPFLSFPVSARADGPVEKFTPPISSAATP